VVKLFWLSALAIWAIWRLLGLVNYRPPLIAPARTVRRQEPPIPFSGRRLRVLTYNVQFFAGTRYRFFYDGGPDTIARPTAVHETIQSIADLIRAENPDVVLLQEVDRGARRTGSIDELSELTKFLPAYFDVVSADYWRSAFVPHPKVWGAVGMQLAILSKLTIQQSIRYQLPMKTANVLVRDFDIKRALLQATLVPGVIMLNTHLEAWPRKTDIHARQVDCILQRLAELDQAGVAWVLGGDFNLEPSSASAEQGHTELRVPPELGSLFAAYEGYPSLADILGPERERYFSYTIPSVDGSREPVKTLDYLFWSRRLRLIQAEVIQERALTLSDHLPIAADFELT
jgi:endonuclease/exonuclease/phosphatase family metal-dependent hydrolase